MSLTEASKKLLDEVQQSFERRVEAHQNAILAKMDQWLKSAAEGRPIEPAEPTDPAPQSSSDGDTGDDTTNNQAAGNTDEQLE